MIAADVLAQSCHTARSMSTVCHVAIQTGTHLEQAQGRLGDLGDPFLGAVTASTAGDAAERRA